MEPKETSKQTTNERAIYLAECFEQSYLSYQYRFVEFFLEHLNDVSRVFGGDLQQVLVLGHVGQMRLHAMKRTVAAGRDPVDIDPSETVVSASSIADAAGIPRQTVRRKLALLKSKGWVEQTEGGGWYLIIDRESSESPAKQDLFDVDQRARLRVARLVADLEKIASSSDR